MFNFRYFIFAVALVEADHKKNFDEDYLDSFNSFQRSNVFVFQPDVRCGKTKIPPILKKREKQIDGFPRFVEPSIDAPCVPFFRSNVFKCRVHCGPGYKSTVPRVKCRKGELKNPVKEIKCVAKTNLTRNGFRRHKVDDKQQKEEHERRNHYFGFGDWFNQTYGIPAEQMSDLDESPKETHMPWELIAHEH